MREVVYALMYLTHTTASGNVGDTVITQLDPDAPFYQQQRDLHTQDAEFEDRLLQRLWYLVKCGRIDRAVRECESCQQHWRAASLR